VEIFSFETLNETHKRAKYDFEKEHVTPYIYRSHPAKFKIGAIRPQKYLQRPDIRVTLDTQEDYALLCLIYDKLYDKNDPFSLKDIVGLFNKEPWIALINKKIIQKKFFDTLEGELQEAVKVLDAQDLKKAAGYLKGKLK
jgi:spore coat polysaccharide biosynthesis protein SpsF